MPREGTMKGNGLGYGEAPRRRTHSIERHGSHGQHRVAAAPDRVRRAAQEAAAGTIIVSRIRDGSCRRTHYDTLRDLPDCCHAPERDEELAGERHAHLLAQAWSAVDACLKPERQRALLLKQQPAPGELDHAATHAVDA